MSRTLFDRIGRFRLKLSDLSASRWMVLGAVCALSSCSTVNVKVNPGTLTRNGIASAKLLGETSGAALASLGQAGVELLEDATHLDGPKAAGHYLQAAIDSRKILISDDVPVNPAEKEALLTLHNDSLGRFAEVWNQASRQAGDLSLNCLVKRG